VVAGAASTPPPPPPLRPAPTPTPASVASRSGSREPITPGPGQLGLRPRLKLTPTATDEEFKTVFEAAGGREAPESSGDAWTWKELLSSMDEAPPSDQALAAELIGEIQAMGVDAAALMPKPRIEEVAAAIGARQPEAALDVIRRLAPAAIRRLSRRLLSDRRLRAQAERFVRGYQDRLDEALADGEAAPAALLGSDEGRAFLLLNGALADVV
jgi:hypothetical protein